MLSVTFPTTLDGYQVVGNLVQGLGTELNTSGSSTTVTVDAPSGKQFLSGVGYLVAIDRGGTDDIIDVLPCATTFPDGFGYRCTQLSVTGLIPQDDRYYILMIQGITATQPVS